MAQNIFKDIASKKPSNLREISSLLEDQILNEFDSNNKIIIDSEWFYYAKAYLQSANILLNNADKNDLLILPALYNLNHGIELTLKTAYRLLEENVDKKHDLNDLYSKNFQVKINNLNTKDLKKLSEELKISEKDLKSYNKNIFKKFKNIVTKYYYQLPLQDTFGKDSILIQDTYNESFRYPETNKVKLIFKNVSSGVVVKINKNKRTSIIKDIKDVILFLNIIYLLGKSK